jgi:hypothetical protein
MNGAQGLGRWFVAGILSGLSAAVWPEVIILGRNIAKGYNRNGVGYGKYLDLLNYKKTKCFVSLMLSFPLVVLEFR